MPTQHRREECAACSGTGEQPNTTRDNDGYFICPVCSGAGEIVTRIVEPRAPCANWTREDSAAATREGWDVFETSRGAEIQRADDVGIFKSDAAAREHVRARASEGSQLHARAIEQ